MAVKSVVQLSLMAAEVVCKPSVGRGLCGMIGIGMRPRNGPATALPILHSRASVRTPGRPNTHIGGMVRSVAQPTGNTGVLHSIRACTELVMPPR